MYVTPDISIITPVWNGLPFLKECINSVLAQDFKNWEMLISDDGSKDGSREYLANINDSRIKIYNQEKNLGIFGNLNFLFAKAQASVSQILCQDDYFVSPGSLTTVLAYWKTALPETGFVRFNHSTIGKCSLTKFQKEVSPEYIPADQSAIYFFVFGNIPGNLSNVSLRTDMVSRFNGFKQKLPYAGDFEFWSRAAIDVNMGVEAAYAIHVRSHEGQASNNLNFNGELIRQKIEVVNEVYDHLIKKWPKLKFLLKLHGTLNYDSLERDKALKILFIKKNKKYYRELARQSPGAKFLFGKFGRWLCYLLSAGGRFGRVVTARLVLKEYFKGLNGEKLF